MPPAPGNLRILRRKWSSFVSDPRFESAHFSMKLRVICRETETCISMMSARTTVREVCRLIRDSLGLPSHFRILVYKGTVLHQALTLHECSVHDESILFLITEQELPLIDDLQEQEERIERIANELEETYGISPYNMDDDDLFQMVDRSVDLMLNQCEVSKRGMIELNRMYKELESTPEMVIPLPPTVMPQPLPAPSEDPLPVMFFESGQDVNSAHDTFDASLPDLLSLGRPSPDGIVSVDGQPFD